jgi:hypothetical protein
MNNDHSLDDLHARIHRAIDPELPRAGVEQRLVAGMRSRVSGDTGRRRLWWEPLRTTLGSVIVAMVVVAIVGGAVGLTLILKGHTRPTVTSAPPPVRVTNPPASPSASPTPSATAYMIPFSVSFANDSDGWTIGEACDQFQNCQVGAARTTDGGAHWSLVTSPVQVADAGIGDGLAIAAASGEDAWVWGGDGVGLQVTEVLETTHDGGRTWQQVNLDTSQVVGVQIADGTAWAETGCEVNASDCTANVLSQPVHGGSWTTLGPVPQAVLQPPYSNAAVTGPHFLRSGNRAWIINANQQKPALVTTSDSARTWTSLPLPCGFTYSMVLGASSPNDLMLACVEDTGYPAPQEVWTSSDGGARWTLRSREGYQDFHPPAPNLGTINNAGAPIGLAVVSNAIAWMANDREDDLVSHNGGVTWTHASLPSGNFGGGGGATAVVFADALHGWTFTSAGVWATSDGGARWAYQPIIGPVPSP